MASLPWKEFPVFTEVVIRWRDLDPFFHVNNAVYFNFLEEGRVAYMKKLPTFQKIARKYKGDLLRAFMEGGDFTFTLVKTSLEFKQQAFLNERLIIGVRAKAIRKVFFDTEYKIFEKKSKKLIAQGEATQLAIDRKTFRPKRLPPEFIQEVEALEGRKLA